MRYFFCIMWIGVMVLSLGGCQGWEVGPRWLGDGGSDPDDRAALSDSGVGRGVSQSVIQGTKR